jgi:hypothetical protein
MCEKHLLRFAFHDFTGVDGKPLLPNDVLWRTISHGVSKETISLFEIIQESIKTTFMENPNKKYSFNPSKTKEQEYYRWIFESYYPNRGSIVPYMWMPRFIEDTTDVSAALQN